MWLYNSVIFHFISKLLYPMILRRQITYTVRRFLGPRLVPKESYGKRSVNIWESKGRTQQRMCASILKHEEQQDWVARRSVIDLHVTAEGKRLVKKNFFFLTTAHLGFPDGSAGKESACNAGDLGSSPGSGRSPGERHGNLLQYSCLENSR